MAKRKLDIPHLIAPIVYHESQDKKARCENSSTEAEQRLPLVNSPAACAGENGDHNNDPHACEGTDSDDDKSETRLEVQATGALEQTVLGGTAITGDATADQDCPTKCDTTEDRATAKRDELVKEDGVTEKDQRLAVDNDTEIEGCGENICNSVDVSMEDRHESANDDEDRSSTQVHNMVQEEQSTKAASTSASRIASPPYVPRPDTHLISPTAECKHAQIYFTVRYPSKASTHRAYKCRITRTKLASSTGVKPWQELKQLETVEHAGERYELGDVVYIYTDEDVDSPARIRDIRDTGDKRGRKEICVSWMWSKEEAYRDCKDTSLWPSGATHTDSTSLQIFPWDTLNGHPTKAEVRASPRVVLDACSSTYALLNWNNSGVSWVSHLQNMISHDDTRTPMKTGQS